MARVIVPVARSLARHGIPVVNAVFGPHPRVRSRAIAQFARLPRPATSDENAVRAFLELLQRERIDYVIPCNDSSLRFVAQHYASIALIATPACPSPEVILRV